MIHRTIRLFALFALSLLSTSLTAAVSAAPPHPNWNGNVTQGADGAYTLGNPAAKVKLTEYVSYTCPHCAHFHQQADTTLRLTMVPQGKVSVTVEQVLRNPIDLTVALLTNCGDARTFFTRHNGFMASQEKWLAKYDSFTPAQKERWDNGPVPTRLRAIASDFDFYTIMGRWGYTRPQVDRCLADAAVLKRVTGQTEAASARGVNATPSFAINDEVLADVHAWDELSKQIQEKL